ncbi:MAG: PaaI family thioesterase [Pseudomonadales bacterium]
MFKQNLQMMPPHGQALGIELVGQSGRLVTVKVPYARHLVGDPDTGVIHGGVITATLDNASGWAIRCHEDWEEGLSMATLDIRIDYMRPAEPGEDLVVEAECFKMTRNVAFVKALAHQGDQDDPVATSVAAFMMGTPSGPRQ